MIYRKIIMTILYSPKSNTVVSDGLSLRELVEEDGSSNELAVV